MPVYRGKAAHPLAALTSLLNASTGTDKVPVCLQRALQCNARATSKAILWLSLYRLRPVASPSERELPLVCLPGGEFGREAVRVEGVPYSR